MSFFFQQRRGNLDIKALTSLDLDRVVKEVDVDLLQLHLENITFSNITEQDLRYTPDRDIIKLFQITQMIIEYMLHAQDHMAFSLRQLSFKYLNKKKELMGKRKEVIELREGTKTMKSQLKLRRKGIRVLEDMLKNAGQQKEAPPTKEETAKPILHFFVSFPDGVCVECRNRVSTKIYELKSEMRRVYLHGQEAGRSLGDPHVIYRGKLLPDSACIGDFGIQEGDTVVLTFEPDLKEEKTPEEPPRSDISPELVQLLSGQQETMLALSEELKARLAAQEERVREGSSTADAAESELLLKMDDRWTRMELAMRKQADNQLNFFAQAIKDASQGYARRSLPLDAGALEDDEERSTAERAAQQAEAERKDLQGQFMASKSRLESLEDTYRKTSDTIEDMMAIIKQQSSDIVSLREKLVESQSKAEELATAATSTPASAKKPYGPASAKFRNAIDKIKRRTPSPPPKPEPAQKAPIEPFSTLDIADVSAAVERSLIPVEFTAALSPDLQELNADTIIVTLPSDVGLTDLIYELRREAADCLSVRLERIALEFEDRVVTLGIDLSDREDFTAAFAQSAAARGQLRLIYRQGDLLTDQQLDELVGQWERTYEETEKSFQKELDRLSPNTTVNSMMFEELGEGFGELRVSLDNILDGLDGRTRLSSDELHDRQQQLRRQRAKLPREVARSFNKATSRLWQSLEGEGDGDGEEGAPSPVDPRRSPSSLAASASASAGPSTRPGTGAGAEWSGGSPLVAATEGGSASSELDHTEDRQDPPSGSGSGRRLSRSVKSRSVPVTFPEKLDFFERNSLNATDATTSTIVSEQAIDRTGGGGTPISDSRSGRFSTPSHTRSEGTGVPPSTGGRSGVMSESSPFATLGAAPVSIAPSFSGDQSTGQSLALSNSQESVPIEDVDAIVAKVAPRHPSLALLLSCSLALSLSRPLKPLQL
jgi:hypothetical protein